MIENVHVAAVLGDDDFQITVVVNISHNNAGPYSICGRIDRPFRITGFTVEGIKCVCPPDNFHRAVVVQVGYGRRRVPTGFAPMGAAAVLPLKGWRANQLGWRSPNRKPMNTGRQRQAGKN